MKLIPAKIFSIDGEVIGVLAFGGAGLIWLLLPFLEPKRENGHRIVIGLGVFAAAYIVGMTIYGYLGK